MSISETDLAHLERCVALATQAVEQGDEPFGSILVSARGEVLLEDHNHVGEGDGTRHPELEIAQWAGAHTDPSERASMTVYTSGEHCPMCAAAHGWVGLGRIVYASSAAQMTEWLAKLGVPTFRVRPLPISEVISGAIVEGPFEEFAMQVRALHIRSHSGLS